MYYKRIAKNLILMVIVIGHVLLLHAQSGNITIHLDQGQVDTIGIFPKISILGRQIKDQGHFKGLPVTQSRHLYRFIFDANQEIFSNYVKGYISHSAFLSFAKHKHLDTAKLYRGELCNSIYAVYYYDSILKKGVVVIDQNFNHDFSDDPKIYSFDSRGEIFPKILIDGIQHYNGKQVIDQSFVVNPGFTKQVFIVKRAIGNTVKEDTIRKLFQFALYPFVRYANILENGTEHRIYISSHDGFNWNFTHGFSLSYLPVQALSSLNSSLSPTLKQGDNFFMNGQMFVMDSVNYDGSRLFLHALNNLGNDQGYVVGSEAGKIQAVDIRSGNDFNSDNLKNKWILLDFWGTWCEPCVAGIPLLKALQKEYNEKIQVISIACEKNNPEDSVKLFAERHNMSWPQFYEILGRSDGASFEYRFKIDQFPTYILLDKNGRIIFRGIGNESNIDLIEKQIKKEP